MKPSLWRSWFAPKEIKYTYLPPLIRLFSTEDLSGAMFWLSGGVSVLIGGMLFSWIWALLVVCIIGILAYVGGYNKLRADYKYRSMAVRFPLAILLGGGIGWGIGFLFFSAINSKPAYQVSFGSQVLVLFLSFAVGLVPSFAVMLKLVRSQLRFYETRNEDEDTSIISDGCAFASFLILAPASLLAVLLEALLKWLPTSFFPAWFTETDPRWVWVIPGGLGLLAAFAVGMGGSIAFFVWRLTWFGGDGVRPSR